MQYSSPHVSILLFHASGGPESLFATLQMPKMRQTQTTILWSFAGRFNVSQKESASALS